IASDDEAAAKLVRDRRRADDRFDLVRVVLEQPGAKAGCVRFGPSTTVSSAIDDTHEHGNRRALRYERSEPDVDASAVRSELHVAAPDRVDHAHEPHAPDLDRDRVAAVLELADHVQEVAMARPLPQRRPRVLLFLGPSLLTGGPEDGLEVVERVVRRHAQRLREPVGRTVTPGGVAVPRLGEGQSCLTASISKSSLAFLPTRTPPVSRATFQVRPKSSRSTSVVAEKPARRPPHGSLVQPRYSTSSVTGRVTP